MLVTKQLMVPSDFDSIYFSIMEVNGEQSLFGYQHSSKYIILWTIPFNCIIANIFNIYNN